MDDASNFAGFEGDLIPPKYLALRQQQVAAVDIGSCACKQEPTLPPAPADSPHAPMTNGSLTAAESQHISVRNCRRTQSASRSAER
jgi:hypothetical protein